MPLTETFLYANLSLSRRIERRIGGSDVPTIVNQKNWNFRIATRARRSHRTGTEYNAIQNTFESVALIWRCG